MLHVWLPAPSRNITQTLCTRKEVKTTSWNENPPQQQRRVKHKQQRANTHLYPIAEHSANNGCFVTYSPFDICWPGARSRLEPEANHDTERARSYV